MAWSVLGYFVLVSPRCKSEVLTSSSPVSTTLVVTLVGQLGLMWTGLAGFTEAAGQLRYVEYALVYTFKVERSVNLVAYHPL